MGDLSEALLRFVLVMAALYAVLDAMMGDGRPNKGRTTRSDRTRRR